MKKKNLEKAVILGLLLSTSIYGTAWASQDNPWSDYIIDKEANTITLNGRLYIPDNYDNYLTLPSYSKIIINSELTNGLYMTGYNYGLIAPDTDLEITVNGKEEPQHFGGTDGLYLGADKFEINNYTAYVHSPHSDAFNTTDYLDTESINNIQAAINGNFKAEVDDGNGIRANAIADDDMKSKPTTVTVKGATNITIKQDLVEETLEEVHYRFNPGDDSTSHRDVKVKYKPAAVYAGDSNCNFIFEGKEIMVDIDGDGNGDISYMAGSGQYGEVTQGKGIVNLGGDIEIETNGYGVFSGKNGEINLNWDDENQKSTNANLKITGKGENAVGIAAINGNLIFDELITVIDNSQLSVLGKNFPVDVPEDVVLDQSENKYGSTVVLNGTNNTITMAEGGKALYADARIEDPNAKDENGNKITVPEVIIKSGDGGIGNLNVKGDIVATNSGKIDLTVNKAADITGDIEATNSGTIDFTLGANADMIVSSEDNTLINAGGASTLSLAKNGSESKIGNVQAANGGTINLTFGEGAYFAGRVDDYKDADGANGNWNNVKHQTLFDSEFAAGVTKSGTVNMTLNGGVWDLTQQSWVTNLNGNDGVVYLNGNGTGGYAVHIGKLEGEHTFVVNLKPTDCAASDMLYIYDGSSAGVQNLRINNEAEVLNALKDDGDRIRFATVGKTAGAGAGFGDDYVVRGRGVINSGFSIDYVDYDTDTHEGNYNGGDSFTAAKPGDDYVDSIYGSGNNNSETGSQASTLENNAGTGNKPVAELDSKNLYLVRDSSKDAGKSDSGATIINMSRANYKNAIYMDRLNKRMGEMRYVNGEEEQGLWVRLRHDRIGQSGDFRSMNTMYEVGYDVKQPTDNGEHRIGMAIDYMRGSTTYDDIMGKGETKRYGLWLYDTWLGEKGHYSDYIVKWGHLSNDFDIRDKDSLENITGDYSNNVFSVSAEYGKKNDMGNNWYFEPQAQLQLARVTGADYVTTQGSKVNVDGINSLIGRAGFRIGRDMDENSTVYLKADLLHEFMGDQTVTAADATGTLREEFENKGTWYDVGFGFATKMSKNSYAFMDFEKSFGNDNDETYQINAGMQWSF